MQTASETCRVLTPNKREKNLHLVGIYMTIITKMHGTINIKYYNNSYYEFTTHRLA